MAAYGRRQVAEVHDDPARCAEPGRFGREAVAFPAPAGVVGDEAEPDEVIAQRGTVCDPHLHRHDGGRRREQSVDARDENDAVDRDAQR